MICLHCSKETPNPRFCSKSCSASHNNIGRRRHGKGPNQCPICNQQTNSSKEKYCSRVCSGIGRTKDTNHKAKINSARQSRYRAKKYRVMDPNADPKIIKEFYLACPPGHEVDHIIPLSRGGRHHQDNLQYLTIKENRSKNNRLVGEVGFEPTK